MGTRHLICIYHNGRFAVAQYGGHDGYPSGAGMTILRFLTKANIKRLREKIPFALPPKPWTGGDYDNRGVEILEDVASARETVERVFRLDFASDGAFCEWAYVVDLDGEGALEVYKGSNHFHGTTTGRFGEAGVVQQELKATFSFDKLPSAEDEFVKACGGDDGEDEDADGEEDEEWMAEGLAEHNAARRQQQM